jgi:hypothetical protein
VQLGAFVSVLRIPVPLRELYECRDPSFLAYVRAVVEVTANTLKEAYGKK